MRYAMTILLACVAVAMTAGTEEPRQPKPYMEIISPFGLHRGGAKWRPEHTLETYREAWEKWPGAMLEADVRLTADGVPVLHHDSTLDRTTEATGPIEALTLAEVKALDAGYRFSHDGGETFPYRGKGLTIATLEEVLEAFPDAHFLFEAKLSEGVVGPMAEVIRRAGAEERVLLASFEPLLMAELREELPNAAHCFDFDSGIRMLMALREGGEAWESFTPSDEVLALMRVIIERFNITPEDIAAIQEKGVFVQLNTLDTPEDVAFMLELGADGLLTDRPDVVAPLLEEHLEIVLSAANKE